MNNATPQDDNRNLEDCHNLEDDTCSKHKCAICGKNEDMHDDQGYHNIVSEWDEHKTKYNLLGALCNPCRARALKFYLKMCKDILAHKGGTANA